MPRVLVFGTLCIVVPVAIMLIVGVAAGADKPVYELIRELFLPMVGPLVAVMMPMLIFFLIPRGENQQKTALDLCRQYFSEEMRDARNTGWRYFVIDHRRAAPGIRRERLEIFYRYLTSPESHGEMEPGLDIVFQKASRVLDFFALVNDIVGRRLADHGIARSFLIYYYLWWRDEIMLPMRQLHAVSSDDPKIKPGWWEPLKHLDQLAKR